MKSAKEIVREWCKGPQHPEDNAPDWDGGHAAFVRADDIGRVCREYFDITVNIVADAREQGRREGIAEAVAWLSASTSTDVQNARDEVAKLAEKSGGGDG